MLAAFLTMANPPRYNERGRKNGEGFGKPAPRADKHKRTGPYTQSANRKLRRLRTLALISSRDQSHV